MKEDGLAQTYYDAVRKTVESEKAQQILHQIGTKGHEFYSAVGSYSGYLGEALGKFIDHPIQAALYLGFVAGSAAVFKGNIKENKEYTFKPVENEEKKRRTKLAADVKALRLYNYENDSHKPSADMQFLPSQRRNIDSNGMIYQRQAPK